MVSRRDLNPTVLIFDADNTIWDTNRVFRKAQLALLSSFSERVPNFFPEKELVTLRQIDRLLFQHLGKFEYDFHLLAVAMAHYVLNGSSVQEAACRAIEGAVFSFGPADAAIVETAHHDYTVALQEVPPLLPDTQYVLTTLRQMRPLQAGLALTLFSEGDPKRLDRILTSHGLRGENVFQATHIGPKSPESFERLRDIGKGFLGLTNGASVQTVVVGDALKREIKYGNQIGATTVYIPAGFMGVEQPVSDDEKPDYSLPRLRELPILMRDINLL